MTGTSETPPDRFSVVIPTHDRAASVLARVAEIRAGDEPADEIIVVSDGSTDGTEDLLCAVAGPDLRVLTTPGLGPASARNLGAGTATGEWLVFLDDDDLPSPGWMRTWRSLAAKHPRASYLSTAYFHRTGPDQHVAQTRRLGPAFSSVRASYMPGTYAVRREAFASVGGFGEGLRFLECTELAVRIFDRLASRPDAFADGTEPSITRMHRPAAEREAVRPGIRVPSSRRAIAAMRPFLERDPAFLANCLAALGVAEIRFGEATTGRRTLLEAARVDPWPPRHVLRAAVASVPPLRRRAWLRGVS
ncbi:hypothetical protein BH10ACT1_BH10ACT1_08040 [soil metagenome]